MAIVTVGNKYQMAILRHAGDGGIADSIAEFKTGPFVWTVLDAQRIPGCVAQRSEDRCEDTEALSLDAVRLSPL